MESMYQLTAAQPWFEPLPPHHPHIPLFASVSAVVEQFFYTKAHAGS
jgi:hypothetical protein